MLNTDTIILLAKRFSLPLSIAIGSIGYFAFSAIGPLKPIGSCLGPALQGSLPYLLFILLFVTFCKIQIREMMPRKWHFILQAIRLSMSVLLVIIISLFDDPSAKIVLEGIFICVICPTAAAAPVIAEKLGGNISSLTIYTIIANIITAIAVPILFPILEPNAAISFLNAMLLVLSKVSAVLVVPLILALACRKVIPRLTDYIKSKKNLAFYIWNFNLIIVTGVTWRNILSANVSGSCLVLLLITPLFITLLQFAIGKAVGRRFGESVTAGQALGQKNTVVGIWLTITFLNPLAAVAPGAYVLWQNMVNAWQLWYYDKHGSLRW